MIWIRDLGKVKSNTQMIFHWDKVYYTSKLKITILCVLIQKVKWTRQSSDILTSSINKYLFLHNSVNISQVRCQFQIRNMKIEKLNDSLESHAIQAISWNRMLTALDGSDTTAIQALCYYYYCYDCYCR